MFTNAKALAEWIALGEKVLAAGADVLAAVRAAAGTYGVASDTAHLEAVIADAERRKALAESEAGADVGSDVPGGGAPS